jgi:hypothetical protein
MTQQAKEPDHDKNRISEPDYPALDRMNDSRLLTPLLLMALIIVAGLLWGSGGPSETGSQQAQHMAPQSKSAPKHS